MTILVLLGAPATVAHASIALPGHALAPASSAVNSAEPSAGSGAQWPGYMADIEHTSYQPDGEALNVSSAPGLQMLWNDTTGGIVVSEPAVVNNTAYYGSWDGYEYAVDANNGTVRWATYTGLSQCTPTSKGNGISDAASIVNGTVYVGGGGPYFYALSATNGSVLWTVYTGNNSPAIKGGGHYNWASPLIVGNYAYLGIASQCLMPMVQGQVVKVDLHLHRIVGVFNVTSSTHLGGAVWSSPAMDPATGKVFFGTGNLLPNQSSNSTLDDSIVSVNSTTMKIVGHFQVPYSLRIPDGDTGGSVTLFSDDHGTPMVGAVNKDGYFFALNRNRLGAGPIWDVQVANNITSSSAAFRGGTLYIGGASTVIGGAIAKGSVRAVNATTGRVLWADPLAGTVFGAVVAVGNGLVVVAGGNELAVIKSTTGQVLWNWSAPIRFYGGPSVADGRIYIGDNNGVVYAFGLPLGASASAAPSNGTHPLRVAFDVRAFGGGLGYTYLWRFGDGTTGTSGTPIHSYKKPGNYTATVTVTDRNGATSTVALSISVSEPTGRTTRTDPRRRGS